MFGVPSVSSYSVTFRELEVQGSRTCAPDFKGELGDPCRWPYSYFQPEPVGCHQNCAHATSRCFLALGETMEKRVDQVLTYQFVVDWSGKYGDQRNVVGDWSQLKQPTCGLKRQNMGCQTTNTTVVVHHKSQNSTNIHPTKTEFWKLGIEGFSDRKSKGAKLSNVQWCNRMVEGFHKWWYPNSWKIPFRWMMRLGLPPMTMETPTSELRPDVDQMIHMVRLWYDSESLAFNKADTCGKGGVVHVICRSSRCFRCCM